MFGNSFHLPRYQHRVTSVNLQREQSGFLLLVVVVVGGGGGGGGG